MGDSGRMLLAHRTLVDGFEGFWEHFGYGIETEVEKEVDLMVLREQNLD
jgi:hypothetical protein